jgi:hypothetical protein
VRERDREREGVLLTANTVDAKVAPLDGIEWPVVRLELGLG